MRWAALLGALLGTCFAVAPAAAQAPPDRAVSSVAASDDAAAQLLDPWREPAPRPAPDRGAARRPAGQRSLPPGTVLDPWKNASKPTAGRGRLLDPWRNGGARLAPRGADLTVRPERHDQQPAAGRRAELERGALGRAPVRSLKARPKPPGAKRGRPPARAPRLSPHALRRRLFARRLIAGRRAVTPRPTPTP